MHHDDRPHRIVSALLTLLWTSTAQTQLMVEQHGTLNIIENDVFMVLSLPVSAFEGVDDDGDGVVTMVEFNRHHDEIMQSLRDNISLINDNERCALMGLMLSPVTGDSPVRDLPAGAVSQIVVMGRYSLSDAVGAIHFDVGLFGDRPDEQQLEIAATRIADHRNEVLELTLENTGGIFFGDRAPGVAVSAVESFE